MGPVVVRVTEEVLCPETLLRNAAAETRGGAVLFWGTVRGCHEGRIVNAVTYDAFVPLGECVLREIAFEAQEAFGPDLGVSAFHRIGRLLVGEASVSISTAAAHRDAAYLANRYFLEQLKVRLPVWKREHYTDGESAWLPGHSLSTPRGLPPTRP